MPNPLYTYTLNIYDLVWFGFYGKSTIVGYLISNPVFTYILITWFINLFCRYIQLKDQTVLFLTIQFSISHQNQIVPSVAVYHKQFN